MVNKTLLVMALSIIVLVLVSGVGYYTGFLVVEQKIKYYMCSIMVSPDPLPDSNLTVGVSNSTLNLDINASAVFPVEFDLYLEPKPPTTFVFSDNTNLFDINPSTGVIAYTPVTGQEGTYTITITVAEASEKCFPKSKSFTLIVQPGAAQPSAGGGGGGGGCSVTLRCGNCINNQIRCEATDSCTGTTIVYQDCVSPPRERVGETCGSDTDCPQGYVCDNSVCITAPAELEELPTEEKPLPAIIYPTGIPGFFNPDTTEYPSPGIVNALRQKLFILSSKLDLSLYNVYYEPQKTPLGLWLKGTHPAVPVIFLNLLIALFVIILLLIGLKKTTIEVNEKKLAMPPEQQI